ncbi:MAG TPA: hypothetical protein DC042_05275 [Bacteroidales bacterium]|nr:hypothetical protein [Bacteroidales bacterium]
MKRLFALLGLLTLLVSAPAAALNPAASESLTITPILSVTPQKGDFYGVQVGAKWTIEFTIKNLGVSVIKIKKIEISGNYFTLADTNSYPFEVLADSSTAFPEGNSGKVLKFAVSFSPADIGVTTGKVTITYGLYSDETREIPLTGEGLSCYAATEAHIGENWAPKPDVWFKFTADKFGIFEINACHPSQPNPGNTERFYLYAYRDCQYRLIPGEEEIAPWCPNDRYATRVITVISKGETIYLFWPLAWPDRPHAKEGFYFNIIATYPTDGDVCENAIPLTLPVVNQFGNTRGLHDDYDQSPCSPIWPYMDGNDIVYTLTLESEGYLTASIIGAWGSIHVLDVCPREELVKDHCKAFTGGLQGGSFRKKIQAGTYYVMVSNWPPPNSMDFLLNLSFESISGIENEELGSQMAVWPNPASDRLNVSVNPGIPADLTIELITLTGQVLYQKRVAGVFDYQDEIDISRFARGFYYIRVNNGKELKTVKVAVE